MPDHRSWGGLLLGLGLVWLALGFRLGLVGIHAGVGVAEAGAGQPAAGGGPLGVALLGVALLTQPESGQPVPRPSRRQRGLSVCPCEPPRGMGWRFGGGLLAMAPARLRAVVHPLVDVGMDAPTGGDTGAVRLVCGDLGAPLEEALSAEAAGLGQGRIEDEPGEVFGAAIHAGSAPSLPHHGALGSGSGHPCAGA